MVKNLSQSSSVKISKNEKMHLNKLIKVLRPKVFIIDNSNFKSLVHELTGNANSNSNYPTTKQPEEWIEQAPIIDLEHDQELVKEAASMDASINSSEWCNYLLSFADDHLSQTSNNNMSYIDDSFFNVSSVNQLMDSMFTSQDIDHSWLFDVVEPSPSFRNSYAQIEQEVSTYSG